MRRRLVISIVGVVVAAVAVVGIGTLILTMLDARQRNEDELAREVNGLAAIFNDIQPGRAVPSTNRLGPALDMDSLRVVPLDPVQYPLRESDIAELRSSGSVARRSGDEAVAAALLPARGQFPDRVLLAVDSSDSPVGPAARWFVVAGLITIAIGVVVALRLARSLTGPLVDAEAATRRITRGEPDIRVSERGIGNDELGRLVRSVNTMAEGLEEARRSEQDFLLSVSHDLRTPLTSIGGWAEALADGAAPDPASAGRTILAEAGRLDRLVRDLLDLARLRAQAFTLTLRPIDLRDVALGVSEGLRPDVEDAGLDLKVDLAGDPVIVDGDADRLAQVAGNLVENAVRHAAQSIRVIVASGGGDAVLMVDDDGTGIPPAERERVFEPLYSRRIATPRPSTVDKGTGLGLATVRALTEAMGGTAEVTEAPDGGARVVVRMPLSPTPLS